MKILQYYYLTTIGNDYKHANSNGTNYDYNNEESRVHFVNSNVIRFRKDDELDTKQ